MRHSIPVLLFVAHSTESIDECVTNCHMFGYGKQRIGKFLRRATPVSYATHCNGHDVSNYQKPYWATCFGRHLIDSET
jgi:hypothetical protein